MTPAGHRASGSPGEAEQLEWEERNARPAAAGAFAGAFLPLVGGVTFLAGLSDAGEGTAGLLRAVDEAAPNVLGGSALSAVGAVALALALSYLYRATLARRPGAPAFARQLLIGSAALLAVVVVAQQFFLLEAASDFVGGTADSEAAADELLEQGGVQTMSFAEAALRVAFGGAIVLVALNAMRAGLLGRFMGILGIGVGAFYAIPFLVEPTLIQLFWGGALGMLFLGRWPGGERGPAWGRVEAIPWPTAAARLERQRRERAEEAQTRAGSESSGDGSESGGEEPDARPASRKRRRRR